MAEWGTADADLAARREAAERMARAAYAWLSSLTVHQQGPAQQRAAMRLVSTGLSPAAYTTVATIIGLENVLDYMEGFVVRFDRERGRDPGMYYLRVFGEPGEQGTWGWRFGGHHVSLNNLVVDGAVVAT